MKFSRSRMRLRGRPISEAAVCTPHTSAKVLQVNNLSVDFLNSPNVARLVRGVAKPRFYCVYYTGRVKGDRNGG